MKEWTFVVLVRMDFVFEAIKKEKYNQLIKISIYYFWFPPK